MSVFWRRIATAAGLRSTAGAIVTLLVAAGVLLFAPGLVALASAADFNPAPGTYTVDTTALTITGPGGTNIAGTNVGGVAVWSFGNVNIPNGATLKVAGNLPFKLVASGTMVVAGIIDGSGTSAVRDVTSGPIPGGPGGGSGGADSSHAGGGSGGGGVTTAGFPFNGGGGGGFGGSGASGGLCVGTCFGIPGGVAGAGGNAYGDLNALFQGGSGGGGAAESPFIGGGGGGGAVALFGSTVTIPSGGQVLANGGGGDTGTGGGSGGGSGGGILIHGNVVNITGVLSAIGGDGGAGGCCGDGGGGGGGRIAYQYVTLLNAGMAKVEGGNSGARSTQAFGHGGLSPSAAGTPGGLTMLQGESATTGAATAVTQTTATLNGTVNPNSSTTTYHFEYGTTPAYGFEVPASDVVIGSDNANHAAAQAITGLAPSTTYHYRIVATDALGLVAAGADATFTTPAAPPPVASVTIAPPVGATVSLTFTCQDPFGHPCAGAFVLTAHEHELGGSVFAVTAAHHKKKKRKPNVVNVTVGAGSYSVAAGGQEVVNLTLNGVGRRLLSRFYALPATVTFTATSGTAIPTGMVRFSYPPVSASIAFNFLFHAGFTTVAQLAVSGAPALGKIAVRCRGGGCSFGQKTFKHKGSVNLAPLFGSARLSPGAEVQIAVSAPNMVGKVTVFTMHAGAAPTQSKLCLPPGSAAPRTCAR